MSESRTSGDPVRVDSSASSAEVSRQAELRFRALIDSAPVMVWLSDSEQRCVFCNKGWLEFTGRAQDDELGDGWLQSMHPDDREPFLAVCKAAVESRTDFTTEYRLRRFDGEYRWISDKGVARIGPDGEFLGYVGSCADITESKQVQVALGESERLFKTFMDNSPAIAFMKNAAGRYVYVNRPFERVFELAGSAIEGRTDAEIWPADLARQFTANDKAVIDGGQPVELFESMPTPDGVLRSWLTLKFPILDAYGNSYLAGMAVDATAHKRAELELRTAKENYESLLDSIDGVVWRATCNPWKYTYVSKGAERLIGMPLSAWFSDPHFWTKCLHPDDRDWAIEYSKRAIREQRSHEFEYRMITGTGRSIWIEAHVTVVVENGVTLRVQGVAVDISKRKLAEEAVRTSEARFRSIIHGAMYGIYRATLDGRILDANPALVAMLGYDTEDELLQVSLRDIYLDPIERVRRIEQLRAFRPADSFETQWRRKDQTLITVRLSWRRIDDAMGAGVEAIVEDVTERRALEERVRQSQRMEAIGRLAGGIAHDFNNLLTAIIGYSDLSIMRLPDGDPVKRNVGEVKKAAGRAAVLTGQLLAFSRKQVLQPRIVDVNAIVLDLKDMLHPLIGEDIELTNKLDSKPGMVRADPGQLEQVLVNLALNSRDAMPTGGKLTIESSNVFIDQEYSRTHMGAPAGWYLVLAVTDTGCGMDRATAARVFEPFFTTKARGKGTGLGLSTVYGIVKQSGGYIWVYSEVGRGTTFKVYLPRIEAKPDPLEAVRPELPASAGSETILLVEDDDGVRSMVRTTLESFGYKVLEARRGDEALSICCDYEERIHLLVTDVIMPQMSGKDLSYRLKELRPETPVLYISGYAENAIVHHGILEDGISFLAKPFTPNDLARKVREVLDK